MLDQSYYQRLYRAAQPEFACRAINPAEVAAWQQAFRPRLRAALGLDGMQTDLAGHQPHAVRVSSEALDGYTREEWRIEVEPGVQLPFYLLLPEHPTDPAPLILTPHGHNPPHIYVGLYHNEEERWEIMAGERDIAVQAVREGYIAIAPTTRGFGETRTPEDVAKGLVSSCRTQMMHGLLLGRTPIGERVWDIEHLIDWALASLPVDPRRIAITGNSGGGTISLFAAACEQRIAAAVPSCYFCTFAGSIGAIHHCDCNYVPGMLRLGEMWDVAGLIAPRPFRAIAGLHDDIFPIDEVRRSFTNLQHIYAAAGVPDNCTLYVGEGGHRYYKAGAWPFIAQQFLG
ncbi:MAG: alpha/beta hydrolase family protein [Anaerolineae bacterium]